MGLFDVWARHHGRLHPVPAVALCGLCLLFVGCGGGRTAAGIQPPSTPTADFSLILSSSSVSVAEGNTSSAINVGITPRNGFSGEVQVSLSGLPSGVTANPSFPFSVSASAPVSLLLSASSMAVAGSVNLTLTGTSGNLARVAPLSLTIQMGTASLLPRNNFVRTDSIAVSDNPPSEPHRRHMVLDAVRQHLFAANQAKNVVDVISTQTGAKLAEITAPGASSADISADGKTIWIGSTTQVIYEIDTLSLQVRTTHLLPLTETGFDRPEEALTMKSGKLMVRVRQSLTSESCLVLWDPVSNLMVNLSSAVPQVLQHGLGPIAKFGDGSLVFVASADSSGEVALFDSNGVLTGGPQTIGGGTIIYAAANKAGTRYGVIFAGGSGTQVNLFDQAFNPIGVYNASSPTGLVFSQDGSSLFVSEQFGGGFVVSSLDANNLSLLGRVPDVAVAGIPTQVEESDGTNLLFGLGNRGISFVDAAISTLLSQPAPSFAAVPVAQPSSGPNSGNTISNLVGSNFGSVSAVQFGGQSATLQSAGVTQLQVTSPASATSGSVNVAAYFQNGWSAFAPDAFSYGPQTLGVLPNAGNKNGNESIAIYGYGFGTDPSKLTVKIGGATATVQKIEEVSSLSSLGFDATFPFPLLRATLQTPSGTPGYADIAVSSSDGTSTLSRGFSYLQSEQIFPKAGFYKFLLFDQKRQHLYLSNIDHVDVFDLNAGAFIAPIQPPGGPPPNSGLRGLALTPDGAQLVIADFAAQNVYVINPDNLSGSSTFFGGITGYASSGPSRVAAASAQTVFIGMSAEGNQQSGCSACLAQMNLSAVPPTVAPAAQPEMSFLLGTPFLQSNAGGDEVFFSFAFASGAPVAIWNASSPGHFETRNANAPAIDLAASADGMSFANREIAQTSIRDNDLNLIGGSASSELERIPSRTEVPGAALHQSGALLYVPFLTGPAPTLPPATNVNGGIDILDVHSGVLRRRIFLPEPFAALSTDIDGQHGSFLAIDENGQRIFAITNSGLTVIQLAAVPLGIGSLTPSSGSAAGGTSVTLRGSGFQSGTKMTFGGKNVVTNFKDMNTLIFTTPAVSSGSQQLILTNPSGESVSLDAAFTAN